MIPTAILVANGSIPRGGASRHPAAVFIEGC